jgi:hypothetical protein
MNKIFSVCVIRNRFCIFIGCSACHSVNPPPKSAPPVVPLPNRSHLRFQTKAQGVAAIAAFLKKPDRQKAVNPQAVSRFVLMPAIPLTDAELKAVSGWFWDQYNPARGGGRGPVETLGGS